MYTAKQVKFGSHIVIGVLFGILAAMLIGTFIKMYQVYYRTG